MKFILFLSNPRNYTNGRVIINIIALVVYLNNVFIIKKIEKNII